MATFRCNLPHLCGRKLTLGGEALSVDAQGECTGVGDSQVGWFEAQPLVWRQVDEAGGEVPPQPPAPPEAHQAPEQSRTPHRAKGRRQRR